VRTSEWLVLPCATTDRGPRRVQGTSDICAYDFRKRRPDQPAPEVIQMPECPMSVASTAYAVRCRRHRAAAVSGEVMSNALITRCAGGAGDSDTPQTMPDHRLAAAFQGEFARLLHGWQTRRRICWRSSPTHVWRGCRTTPPAITASAPPPPSTAPSPPTPHLDRTGVSERVSGARFLPPGSWNRPILAATRSPGTRYQVPGTWSSLHER
jgi:hypothetical protein